MTDNTADSDRPAAPDADPDESDVDVSDAGESSPAHPADSQADDVDGAVEDLGVDTPMDDDADAGSSSAGAEDETEDAAADGPSGGADAPREPDSDSRADASGEAPAAGATDGSGGGRSRWNLDGRTGRGLAVVGALALAAIVIVGAVWAGRAIFDRDGRSDRDHRGDDGRRGELIASFDGTRGDKRHEWSSQWGKDGDKKRAAAIRWGKDLDGGDKGDRPTVIIIHRGGLKQWNGDFGGKDMFGGAQCPGAESPRAKCLGGFAERRRGGLGKGDWGKGHFGFSGPFGGDGSFTPFGGQGFSGRFGGNGSFGPFGGNGFMAPLDRDWSERDGWGFPDVPKEGYGDFWGRLWDGDEWDGDEGPWSDLDDLLGDGSDSWWDPDDLDEEERRELAEFCAALDSGALLDELDEDGGAGLLLFGFPIFDSLFEELCSDTGLDPDSQAETDDDTATGDA